MFGIIPAIQAVFSFLGGVAPAISGYFQTKANVENTEFASMNATDQAEAIALVHAQTELNNAKVLNNSHGAAQIMVYLFGLPIAIHWWMVIIVSCIPAQFHPWVIPALPEAFAGSETKIALSFFLLAPALPIVSSLASRIRG